MNSRLLTLFLALLFLSSTSATVGRSCWKRDNGRYNCYSPDECCGLAKPHVFGVGTKRDVCSYKFLTIWMDDDDNTYNFKCYPG